MGLLTHADKIHKNLIDTIKTKREIRATLLSLFHSFHTDYIEADKERLMKAPNFMVLTLWAYTVESDYSKQLEAHRSLCGISQVFKAHTKHEGKTASTEVSQQNIVIRTPRYANLRMAVK
jgi:hypothetical protein